MIGRWLRALWDRLRGRRPEPEPPLRRRVDDPWYRTPEEIKDAELGEAHHDEMLGRGLRVEVEDNINASFGLPPVWRCPCGGRPFVGRDCPRCHRSREEAGV